MQTSAVFAALLAGAFSISASTLPVAATDASTRAPSFHFVPGLTRGQLLPARRLADADSAKQAPAAGQNPLPRCEEAVVNPVTGHAECMRPRGAAVDPPPQSAVPCATHSPGGEKRGCPTPPG
jgi:hypothetical protein